MHSDRQREHKKTIWNLGIGAPKHWGNDNLKRYYVFRTAHATFQINKNRFCLFSFPSVVQFITNFVLGNSAQHCSHFARKTTINTENFTRKLVVGKLAEAWRCSDAKAAYLRDCILHSSTRDLHCHPMCMARQLVCLFSLNGRSKWL